jgi:phosphatidylglycerophosphate synthase
VARVRGALVQGTLPGAAARVAGLPLAIRAALALRHAGFEDVAILASPRVGRWRRALAARGVPVAWVGTPDEAQAWGAGGDVLVLAGNVLVDAEALSCLREGARGPVRAATGPVIGHVVAGDQVKSAVAALETAAGKPPVPGAAPTQGPATRLEAGLAVPLGAAGSPRALEEHVLDTLARRTAAGDSYLASLIDRRLSRPLTRLLLRTPVTPSQVTLLSVAAGLLGAAGLATVSHGLRVGGVLLLVLSIILDCVDGEIARARYQQSAAGARLDVVGDYLVHLAVFVGLATGLLRQGLPPGGVWVAAALVAGVGASMLAMHLLFIRPALRGGGDLHWSGGEGASLRGSPVGAVAEKIASRDYTYVLLVLALAGRLEWFFYATAAGSWAFVTAILVYRLFAVSTRRREAAAR